MAVAEQQCTILLTQERPEGQTQEEICRDLEQPHVPTKIKAIKTAIALLLSGEPMPRLLMSVIKGCLKEESKELKKLVTIYWEVAKKYGPDGALLPEMILVCNALRNDLNHPNEFVRGATLRFLCRLQEPELLEPLIPTIKACLDNHGPGRQFYVRKYAAQACLYIHKRFGDALLPDGPEIIAKFIAAETDDNARRSAFLFLFSEAEDTAIDFLNERINKVKDYGDGFQLLVLELCRRVCRRDPIQKSRFIRVLLAMVQSPSAAVAYEAAWTMVTLSSAPTAVRTAASTYAHLINSQSDNNVKLIVLERLKDLKKQHTRVLEELVMDILRALSSPSVLVCQKVLEIAVGLVTTRNVVEVVTFLKREMLRTQETDADKNSEYRPLLVHAIHSCAHKSSAVALNVVHTLVNFLSGEGALEVVIFLRAIVEEHEVLREEVLQSLVRILPEIANSSVLRVALWVLGTYCIEKELLLSVYHQLISAVGQPSFDSAKNAAACSATSAASEVSSEAGVYTTKNIILSDGTYASQTILSAPTSIAPPPDAVSSLRQLICDGDILLGTCLSSCLTKMTIRILQVDGPTATVAKEMQIEVLRIICGVNCVAEQEQHSSSYQDSVEQLQHFAAMLLDPETRATLGPTLLEGCQESFSRLLALEHESKDAQADKEYRKGLSHPDKLINFRQLLLHGLGSTEADMYDDEDITKATGIDDKARKSGHVVPLSGYSDPVYVEALVMVHDYDIILEITVINRTPNTLTNLTVELATIGDLRIVERPQAYTIGPLDEHKIRTDVKVSSTETGYIFGTVAFDNSSTTEKTYINLNDIHVDIMDYIKPGKCTDAAFRSMWAEFEWENKVAVCTKLVGLRDFLTQVIEMTKMSLLTPQSAIDGSTSFLAANLYAVSVFGESALMNVSIEKTEEGTIAGHVRIRSKTQGIALSLGDRIAYIVANLSLADPDPPQP